MKKLLYVLCVLIVLFSYKMVYAENDVIVKSITPIYDESSSLVVTNSNGTSGVTFNDKGQSIQYKVVIENVSEHNLKVNSVDLTTPSESYLVYELTGLEVNDTIKMDEEKEVILSFETIETENWGKNFDEKIGANITFSENPNNPITGSNISIVLVLVTLGIVGVVFVFSKNKKIVIPILLIGGSLVAIPKSMAYFTIDLDLKINVNYESQNVMKKSRDAEGNDVDFWQYRERIKYITFEYDMVEPENYELSFDVSEKQDGKVMAYLVNNGTSYHYYDLIIQSDGVLYANPDASYYFFGMTFLDEIHNLHTLKVDNVTNMDHMFHMAGISSDVFVIDLGNDFDTSNVTNMDYMFFCVGYHNPEFTMDLGDKFDTSNVTTMKEMFGGTAIYSEVFTLDLGDKFDTSNVTNMSGMFSQIALNSDVFTLDLGDKFDTSKVTDMSEMFYSIGGENPNFVLNLGDKFDTSNVINMYQMFYNAGDDSTSFNILLGDKFNLSKVENTEEMFYRAGDLSPNFNIELLIDNPNITSYNNMFGYSATTEGAQIIVNYTSETSTLVDQLVATKSTNSNVVKGVQVD